MPHVGSMGRTAGDEGNFAMPVSIKRFSRTFLGWVVLNIVYSLITLDLQRAVLSRNPQTAGFNNLPIFSLVFMTAIAMLLWFLIVKRASSVARWTLTIIFVFITLWTLRSIGAVATAETLPAVLIIALLICQVLTIVFLFAPDARAWLGRRHGAEDVAEGESHA